MHNTSSFTVFTPATTANLGPGFDCLGLSLDLWNQTTLILSGDSLKISISGEGAGELPLDESNLIYRSFCFAASKHAQKITPGISIDCLNHIPVSSGLGSSSAAVIAGLMAANYLMDLQMTDHEIITLGLELEGHADNISACLLGGLITVLTDETIPVFKKWRIQPLQAAIALPQIALSTKQARKVMPKYYSRDEVIFNIGRASMLLGAFITGEYDLMRIAMEDRIHQPYRLGLIPGATDAIKAALDAGAYGAALSGAGPSVIAFYDSQNEALEASIQEALRAQMASTRIFSLSVIEKGAFIL